MLDDQRRAELITTIANDKQLLDAIANASPQQIAQVEEYIRIWNRIVENERQLNALDGLQRAYVMPLDDVKWDKRTKDVLIISQSRGIRQMSLVFQYAKTAYDELNKLSIVKFENVAWIRQSRTQVESIHEYPLGIVGLDGLGAFVVEDSQVMKQLQVDTTTMKHYCLVFSDGCVECIATGYEIRTCPKSIAREALSDVLQFGSSFLDHGPVV